MRNLSARERYTRWVFSNSEYESGVWIAGLLPVWMFIGATMTDLGRDCRSLVNTEQCWWTAVMAGPTSPYIIPMYTRRRDIEGRFVRFQPKRCPTFSAPWTVLHSVWRSVHSHKNASKEGNTWFYFLTALKKIKCGCCCCCYCQK